MENWIDLNRQNRDERAEPHAKSPGYGAEQFAIPNQMEALPGGEYRLKDRPWRVPHSYTLQAVKAG